MNIRPLNNHILGEVIEDDEFIGSSNIILAPQNLAHSGKQITDKTMLQDDNEVVFTKVEKDTALKVKVLAVGEKLDEPVQVGSTVLILRDFIEEKTYREDNLIIFPNDKRFIIGVTDVN